MPDNAEAPAQTQPRPRRALRRAAALAAAFLALLLLAGLLLAALPSLLSTDRARGLLVERIAQATGRPATLESLDAGWTTGLRLRGLSIGGGGPDDPGFLLGLESLRADFGFVSLLRGKVWADVELSGLRLRLEPASAPAPAEPEIPAKPLPQAIQQGLEALRQAIRPSHFSGDLRLRVALRHVQAVVPADNASLRITDAALDLDAPSLRGKPLRLSLSVAAQLDGNPLPPLTLQAELADLVDSQRQMRPGQARISAEARASGLHLGVSGSLATGLRADLALDLRELLPPLRPLLPAAVPQASGRLALGALLSLKGQDSLAASLLVTGEGLSLSGGSLGARAAGPLQFSLLQEAGLDLAVGGLDLPGTLSLLDGSKASWRGRASGLAGERPELALSIDTLRLDLAELLRALRGFLPPDLRLAAATLSAEGLEAAAALPTSKGGKPGLNASVRALSLEAGGISQGSAERRVSLDRAVLRVDRLAAALPSEGPGSAELSLSASADAIRLAGPRPLTVRRAALTSLAVRGVDLALDPAALFGLSGTFSAQMASEASGLALADALALPAVAKSQALRLELPAAKTASLALEHSRVHMPGLRLVRAGKRPLELPTSVTAEVPAITLTRPGDAAPLAMAVQGAHVALQVGQALRADLTASLSAGRELASRGSLSLDADRLLALAAAVLPVRPRGSGALALDWDLAATLPQGDGAPVQEPRTTTQRLKALGFLHRAEANLSLRDLSLDLPLEPRPGKPRETLRLRGLTTPRPLRLATRQGLAESSLTGSLAFGPLSELPGAGALRKPVRGLLTVNAAQQGLRSVQAAQMLTLEGFGLTQNLSVTLDKLDAVLDRVQAGKGDALPAALELADATASFSLKTGLDALADSGRDITGRGAVELGADLRLAGGRSLSVAARLASPGLNLALGPELALTGLRSDLSLRRRYALRPGLACPGAVAEAVVPLSEQVFDLFPPPAAGPQSEGFGLRALYDAQAQRRGSLAFAALNLKSGPLPVNLHDFSLRLDTSGPLPAIPSFRLGLFGGNILGSAAIRRGAEGYAVEADCAFTGIDTARMQPGRAQKDLGDQAELSGRVNLRLPLTPDPETLLTRLNLRADITKVGPRTLERALYALDPDEQNETIVQQRRLMGMGYPRNLRLLVAYGNLSLSGQVEVKGFRLDIPPIDRLAVANLPVRDRLGPALGGVPALAGLLDMLSATSLCRDPSAPRLVGSGSLNLAPSAPKQGVTP